MRRVRCPKCGRVHEIPPDHPDGRFFLPCGEDHDLVIWVSGGMVREVDVAESVFAKVGFELIPERAPLTPSWVDMDRVRALLSGRVRPSSEDIDVLMLLEELGVVRRKARAVT